LNQRAEIIPESLKASGTSSEVLQRTYPEEDTMLQLSVITQNWIQLRLEEIRDRETGATAVEYALMVGLIAVGIIGAVAALRNKVSSTFNNVNNAMGK
jgi:pilus assembly protein Flp/PilA